MTDDCRQRIVELDCPDSLVLAGPGCGKTHLLAQRVLYACAVHGIAPEHMLCLTFTNRAAREMAQRLGQCCTVPKELFVGNLHRFCLRFLFENRLVHADTVVIDSSDTEQYIKEHGGPYRNPKPQGLTCLANCLLQDDLGLGSEPAERPATPPEEWETDAARAYMQFKRENRLIEFDEILIRAYAALRQPDAATRMRMSRYRWIIIDEVQDLTPLQLAIVDLLRSPDATVMYLGDAQQSIFGFAGAGKHILEQIGLRCKGNIFRLRRNYRATAQLVKINNSFARQMLDADPGSLPAAGATDPDMPDPLLLHAGTAKLAQFAAALARTFVENDSTQTTAILTRTNAEAEDVSGILEQHGLKHLLVSRNDLFHSTDVKTILSHLAVIHGELRSTEWARLLYGTHITRSLTGALHLVQYMRQLGMNPRLLFDLDARSETEICADTLADADTVIAVIDTETTGLDTDNDDILQMAAVKIKNGRIIPDSGLNIFISRDKPLPTASPVHPVQWLERYEAAGKTAPQEAFEQLAAYLENCVIAGHNLPFDLAILRSNMRRRTSVDVPETLKAQGLDTLTLSRLLYPDQCHHNLGFMLGFLGIGGSNSHDAAEDAAATASLLLALGNVCRQRMSCIGQFRRRPDIRRAAARFAAIYEPLYRTAVAQRSMAQQFDAAYSYMLEHGIIKPIRHRHYLSALIDRISVNYENGRGNIGAIRDIMSFNEADLYSQAEIGGRLLVMTVHKAKGMEMDNVIIYDGTPHAGSYAESLRVLYVAMSRARFRLAVGFSTDPYDTLGYLVREFHTVQPGELAMMLMRESARMPSNHQS